MFGPERLVGRYFVYKRTRYVYRVDIVLPQPPLFAMRVSHRRLHALRRRSFIVARESLLTSPPKCCWRVRPHTRDRLTLVRRHVLAATLPAPRHRISPARSLRNSKPEMAEHLCAGSVRLSPCRLGRPFAVYCIHTQYCV